MGEIIAIGSYLATYLTMLRWNTEPPAPRLLLTSSEACSEKMRVRETGKCGSELSLCKVPPQILRVAR
jgi:hypothetical protein